MDDITVRVWQAGIIFLFRHYKLRWWYTPHLGKKPSNSSFFSYKSLYVLKVYIPYREINALFNALNHITHRVISNVL